MTSNEIGFLSVKVASIFIFAILYFIAGSILSILIDRVLPEENTVEERTTLELFLIISSTLGFIAVAFYFIRKNIKHIPFFLDGLYGFDVSRLKEIGGGVIITYTIYTYQDRLTAFLKEFKKRINRLLDLASDSVK